jgi:hypothetical protein
MAIGRFSGLSPCPLRSCRRPPSPLPVRRGRIGRRQVSRFAWGGYRRRCPCRPSGARRLRLPGVTVASGSSVLCGLFDVRQRRPGGRRMPGASTSDRGRSAYRSRSTSAAVGKSSTLGSAARVGVIAVADADPPGPSPSRATDPAVPRLKSEQGSARSGHTSLACRARQARRVDRETQAPAGVAGMGVRPSGGWRSGRP